MIRINSLKFYQFDYIFLILNIALFYFLMQLDHGPKNYVHTYFSKSFYLPFQNYVYALIFFFILSIIYFKFKEKIIIKKNILFRVNLTVVPILFLLVFIYINISSKQTYVITIHDFTKNLIFYFTICLATISLIYVKNNVIYLNNISKNVLRFSFFLVSILISSFLLLNEYSYYLYLSPLNLSAAYSSIVNSLAGLGSNINFENQYGSYANFLSPLINLFFENDLSIFKISLVLSSIFFLLCFCLFLFFEQTINNTFISTFSFFGLIFFKFFFIGHLISELYFADSLVRFLPVVFTLALFAWNFKSEKLLLLIFSSNIIFIFLFWNLETGLMCFLSFLFVNFFLQILNKKYGKFLLFFLSVIITLPFTYFLLQLYFVSMFGSEIDLNKLFQSPMMYGGTPTIYKLEYMLNFSLLIFFILFYNLFFSLRNLISKQNIFIDKIKFALSILGLSVITYYVSRFVHLQTSVTSGYISFILLSINCYEALRFKVFNTSFISIKFLKIKNYITIFIWLFFVMGFFITFGGSEKGYKKELARSQNFIDYLLDDKLVRKEVYSRTNLMDIKTNPSCAPACRFYEPEWILKKNYIRQLLSKKNNTYRDDLLILSQNDYYYNLAFNNKSSIIRTNFAHMHTFCDYENIFLKIKEKKFEYVIIDSITEPVLSHELFDELLKFLEMNYDKKIHFFDLITSYPRYKNLSQSKFEYLYIFTKNENKKKEIQLEISDWRPLCDKFGTFTF